jgi:bleomycin hydrolase
MISSIVAKYGIVPKSAMPESACSSATSEMNGIVTKKLREFAAVLRKEHKNGKSIDELREIKTQQMCTVYRMLSICLGTPPETFDFEVLTKDKEFISDKNITPKEFFDKYVKVDLSQYVSLINSPTEDKPYMHSYTVKFLGNVIDGTPVRYVNLPIEELKKAAIAQMKDNEPVWFGCDVGKRSARDSGVMSLEAYDYDNFFSTTFDLSKAEGLDYGYSMMTHAMVFQGVDLDENGNPTKWCVENSWGPDAGNKGMYMMTDSWFDKYMYQIVVQKKYLSPEILVAYEAEPIVLEPWDPMGALA